MNPNNNPKVLIVVSGGIAYPYADHGVDVVVADLDDKGTSQKTKESILDWIFEDDDRPFSFRNCAILSGCDPQKLRDQIIDLVRRLKIWRMAA